MLVVPSGGNDTMGWERLFLGGGGDSEDHRHSEHSCTCLVYLETLQSGMDDGSGSRVPSGVSPI